MRGPLERIAVGKKVAADEDPGTEEGTGVDEDDEEDEEGRRKQPEPESIRP